MGAKNLIYVAFEIRSWRPHTIVRAAGCSEPRVGALAPWPAGTTPQVSALSLLRPPTYLAVAETGSLLCPEGHEQMAVVWTRVQVRAPSPEEETSQRRWMLQGQRRAP